MSGTNKQWWPIILAALADGPKPRIEVRRAVGMSVPRWKYQSKLMKQAGLIIILNGEVEITDRGRKRLANYERTGRLESPACS